jgi:subtilisin-like proprotein convertase family protein
MQTSKLPSKNHGRGIGGKPEVFYASPPRQKHRRLRLEPLERRELLAAIQGTVFEDIDWNGIREEGESGIVGATVYLDTNRDGLCDAGETAAVTDENGAYTIDGLDAGSYTVAQQLPAQWLQTSPGPLNGPSLLGEVLDEFAAPEDEPIGLAWDGTFLYCLERNGSMNEPMLYRRDGDVWSLQFQVRDPGGASIDLVDITYDGTDFWGVERPRDLIVRFNATTGMIQQSISLVTLDNPDPYPSGIAWDGTAGCLWVADRGNNAIYKVAELDSATPSVEFQFTAPDAGQTSSIHALAFDGRYLWMNRWDTSNAAFNRTYQIDPGSGEVLRSFLSPALADPQPLGLAYDGEALWLSQYRDDWICRMNVATPCTLAATISGDETIAGVDFGRFRLGSVAGTVFEDCDGNGSLDDGEPGLEGWRVFVDENANGSHELYEQAALTNASGAYAIDGLKPGDHIVTAVLRSPGWTPAGDTFRQVTVAASGTSIDQVDFAVIQTGVAPVGPEVRVNSTSEGVQNFRNYSECPAHNVAMDDLGNWVVTWQAIGPDGSLDIFARRYSPTTGFQGGDFRVNQVFAGAQENPLVAIACETGAFVVIWHENYGVYGQLFDAGGAALGGPFEVVSGYSRLIRYATSIGMDADGNFIVGYQSCHIKNFVNDRYFTAQRFNALGQKIGKPIVVNPPGDINVAYGRVDMGRDGRFATIWDDPSGVFVQRYDAAGTAVGTAIRVASGAVDFNHDVAIDSNGGFFAAWEADGLILGQSCAADGTPRGDVVVLAASYYAQFSLDAGENVLLAWESRGSSDISNIRAQRFSITGVPIDPAPFLANTTTVGYQQKPSAVCNPAGDFVVAWDGAGADDPQGIFAQQYRASSPAPPTPGITVSPTTGLVTSEDGLSTLFSVTLDSQPESDVTMPIQSGDPGEGTVQPTTLIFTRLNWNTPQTVTVTGVDDDEVDGDVAYTVVLSPATSGDPAYNGLNPDDVAIVNWDNDGNPSPDIFVSPDTPLVVADAHPSKGEKTTTSRIDVTTHQAIVSLTVEVSLDDGATNVADLRPLVLTAPSGVSSVFGPASGVNVYTVTAFNGLDPYGTWTLAITDFVKGTVHLLNSWTITINAPQGGAVAGSPATSTSTDDYLRAIDLAFLEMERGATNSSGTSDRLKVNRIDPVALMMLKQES